MNADRIYKKAEQLGLDTSGANSEERLGNIADQLGVDVDNVESALDDELLDTGDGESLYDDSIDSLDDIDELNPEEVGEAPKKFGEEEFDAALGDKDYYKNKDAELQEELRKAEEEAAKDYKEVDDDSESTPKDTDSENSDSPSEGSSSSTGDETSSNEGKSQAGDSNSESANDNKETDSNNGKNNSTPNADSSNTNNQNLKQDNNTNSQNTNDSQGQKNDSSLPEKEKSSEDSSKSNQSSSEKKEDSTNSNDNKYKADSNKKTENSGDSSKKTVQKNKADKRADKKNVKNAKKNLRNNKISQIKKNAYAISHPLEAAKKSLSNKAKNLGKKALKNTAKAIGKAGKKLAKMAVKLIVSNPIILLGAAILFLIILIVIIFTGDGAGGGTGAAGSQLYNSACDFININETSLSKEEFINKIQTYSNGTSMPTVFSENAGTIYNIAVSNDINPELVIVRAEREGYSPGASNNNYWGLGCSNGASPSECSSYDSFDAGVLAFVQNISQYESVSAMMSKYAYIGSYWYSANIKGASGTGGCYYYEHIKDFMPEARADEVSKICTSSNNCDTSGTNCVSTTEEDQTAYAKWQVYEMAKTRKTIFGIEPDICGNYSEGCTIYAQGDSNWGNVKLGGSSSTMESSGCAVTAIAIGISCSGTRINLDNFNAGTFVKELNSGGCLTSQGYINWGCPTINYVAPDVEYVDRFYLAGDITAKKNVINSYTKQNNRIFDDLTGTTAVYNYFIIPHFVNSSHSRGHYVVFDSWLGTDKYNAKDPGSGKITTQNISEIDHIIVYRYKVGS